jgi:hypothetical protein
MLELQYEVYKGVMPPAPHQAITKKARKTKQALPGIGYYPPDNRPFSVFVRRAIDKGSKRGDASGLLPGLRRADVG